MDSKITMSKLTLYTSGSTKEPKEISHDWDFINECAKRSINELGLTSSSVVLNVLPYSVIGYFTITAYPAMLVGANLINANFDPYTYIKLFNKFRPTHIGLINRHYEVLKNIKGFESLDMSCVEYMTTGSDNVTEEFINAFLSRGVKKIGNWYGMTEFPPPVMIAYNGLAFTKVIEPNQVTYIDNECIINGIPTGDIFINGKFSHRKSSSFNSTWKTNL
jgi:acyl-coenzyme A synthetase/AMP-(fatty) acid ligase